MKRLVTDSRSCRARSPDWRDAYDRFRPVRFFSHGRSRDAPIAGAAPSVLRSAPTPVRPCRFCSRNLSVPNPWLGPPDRRQGRLGAEAGPDDRVRQRPSPKRTSPMATFHVAGLISRTPRGSYQGVPAVGSAGQGTMLVSTIVRGRKSWNPYRCWIAPGGAAHRRLLAASTEVFQRATKGFGIHRSRRRGGNHRGDAHPR
jgi:hypothetical protein